MEAHDRRLAAKESMFFLNAPTKRIDYVVAYGKLTTEHEASRQQFEGHLKEALLELEYEDKSVASDKETNYVKIHCPWDALLKGAELLRMRKPLGISNNIKEELSGPSCFSCCQPSAGLVPEEDDYFTGTFDAAKLNMFDIPDRETFFTNAERSYITKMIMDQTMYDTISDGKHINHVGVESLVRHGIYMASYPLHEGPIRNEGPDPPFLEGPDRDRERLYYSWAKFSNMFRFQPLDLIRKYFGEKIAMYFAWLGIYTLMLIPASLFGIAVFLYGLATIGTSTPVQDVCTSENTGSYYICPLCNQLCDYELLNSSCIYARLTHVFDNNATVAMAVFMSAWALCFLEIWERYEKDLQYDWDINDFEKDEIVRPEFQVKVKGRRQDPITQKMEPYVSTFSKCCRFFTSVTIILFLIALVLGSLFGVLLYRLCVVTFMYRITAHIDPGVQKNTKLIITVTSSIINLLIITIFSFIYQRVARTLTNLELHRTETSYEDAYTFKMIIFQFINYYGSIFYIAFFKGSFVDPPGKSNMYIFGTFRQDQCDVTGCFIELTIQLVIVMVGKQVIGNIMELVLPLLKKWWRGRNNKGAQMVYMRWEQDLDLEELGSLGLFGEYLEMVIQFGFVTLFVAAFPLAPLCALINNLIEIRLDASKLIKYMRRPPALKTQDIGAWYSILKTLAFIAVVTNAFIIAWTSDFIPRMVYMVNAGSTSLTGFIDNSLQQFNTSDFPLDQVPNADVVGDKIVSVCRYRAYTSDKIVIENDLGFTSDYWLIFTARLAFVIVFEHCCFLLIFLVMQVIPTTSARVQRLRRYERELNQRHAFENKFNIGQNLANFITEPSFIHVPQDD